MQRAPRLLFLILSHNHPEDVAGLAGRLVDVATDAQAWIHFDAGAAAADMAILRAAVGDLPRVRLVEARVRCRWGDYSLVEAALRTLRAARDAGDSYDYVVLLSASCLPCRPIADLERFLVENSGKEFIETSDASWIFGGLRAERHQLYFFFPPGRRQWADRWNVAVQRLLGIKRQFPAPLRPRFGSQWWTLSWGTCNAILDHLDANPSTVRFFRRTYIPDELVFPSLVDHLVPAERIAGRTLTHFQFTNWGKPVVYFDDHADYVPTLNRFFVRKVSPEARALRARLLERAGLVDAEAALPKLGPQRLDYAVKVRAQTGYPAPGQIFYRDQFLDQAGSVLKRATRPYIVVVGPPALAAEVQRRFRADTFARLGAPFTPDRVDLGDGHTPDGLGPNDTRIRDLHPALYLTRLRARSAKVPVLSWGPFDHLPLLQAVLDDPAAMVLRLVPHTARADAIWRWLYATCPPADDVIGRLPHVPAERWSDARRDRALDTRLGWDAFAGLAAADAARRRLVTMPVPLDDEPDAPERRHRLFTAELEASIFAREPWFDAAAADLGMCWDGLFADARTLRTVLDAATMPTSIRAA